jgi:hypothetical protein
MSNTAPALYNTSHCPSTHTTRASVDWARHGRCRGQAAPGVGASTTEGSRHKPRQRWRGHGQAPPWAGSSPSTRGHPSRRDYRVPVLVRVHAIGDVRAPGAHRYPSEGARHSSCGWKDEETEEEEEGITMFSLGLKRQPGQSPSNWRKAYQLGIIFFLKFLCRCVDRVKPSSSPLPAAKASHIIGENLTHGQAWSCRWSEISLTRAATPSDWARPRLRSATQLGLSSPAAWASRATGDTNVRSNATMMMTTRWGTEGQHARVRRQWLAARSEAASWTPSVLFPLPRDHHYHCQASVR